jgi:DNA-binding transcriptional LysR family regulator
MTTQVFDLGLTEDDFEREDAAIEPIPVADMVCVLPARHRLAGRMVLEPEDFAGESFVHFEQNDPYRRKLDQVFVVADVVRSYAAETTTAASVCAMVGMGVGVSVINPLTAASHTGRNVVFRKLSVSVPYTLSVWRPRRSSRAGQAEKVVAAVKEVVSEMRKNLKATLAR